MTAKSRKAKNILLMPGTQLRYIYYVLALATAPMVIVMGMTLMELSKIRAILSLLDHLPPELYTLFSRTYWHICFSFGLAVVVCCAAVIFGVLVISHRFVGPAYVINRYISSVLKGEPVNDRELRTDDELKETWDLVRELGERYRKNK